MWDTAYNFWEIIFTIRRRRTRSGHEGKSMKDMKKKIKRKKAEIKKELTFALVMIVWYTGYGS
jgi:hypothetical protein